MAANQRHKSSGRKSQAQPGAAATGYMDDMREQASDYYARGRTQLREMTEDHEGTAVVVAMAAGFGIGLLIGASLAASQSQPKTWRDRIAAEGLGSRLMERMEQMLPDAVTDYVHGR